MSDINEVKFSGTIERLRAVPTKSGTSMASLLLKVGRNKFKVVAFKNVADAILCLKDGDRLTVSGNGSINSWKDADEHWHNDFQATAWSAEVDGSMINYEKSQSLHQHSVDSEQPPLPPESFSHETDQFAHRGGPF